MSDWRHYGPQATAMNYSRAGRRTIRGKMARKDMRFPKTHKPLANVRPGAWIANMQDRTKTVMVGSKAEKAAWSEPSE